MQPVRLLFVTPGISGGGTERSLCELAPKLVDHEIDVSIAYMVRRPTDDEESLEQAGVRLLLIDEGRLSARLRALRRLIAARQPDIVHTMLFEGDLAGRLAAWRLPATTPVVMSSLVNTSYGPARLADPNVRPWKLHAVRLADGWTARHLTNHFHAVSRTVKDSAVEALGIEPERVTVIERGRDPGRLGAPSSERRARVRAAFGIGMDTDVILAVGRQEFQKGHEYLVLAFDVLAGSIPGAELLFVGPPGHQSQVLRTRIAQSSHRNRIRVLGHREDVPDLLAAADVFALPSLYEGFPGAVIEAMALGLPVVASRLTALQDMVEDGQSAVLVPPGDPKAMAEALAAVLRDPKLSKRLGARGRELFLANLTADQSHKRMIDLYHRLVAA